MGEETDDYTVPFSLRLTRAQRQQLDEDAGSKSMGEYVRSRLFTNPTPLKHAFRRPVQNEQALTQMLGALGKGRLSSNLNQIAKAIHTGSYPASPETETAILAACAEVSDIRASVLEALGYEAVK